MWQQFIQPSRIQILSEPEIIDTEFKSDEVLNHCQQLESIEVRCGGVLLDETKLLEMIVKLSPKIFDEMYFT